MFVSEVPIALLTENDIVNVYREAKYVYSASDTLHAAIGIKFQRMPEIQRRCCARRSLHMPHSKRDWKLVFNVIYT